MLSDQTTTAKSLLVHLPWVCCLVVVSAVLLRGLVAGLVMDIYTAGIDKDVETIELSLQHSLMQQDFQAVQEIINSTAHQKQTELVRLISPDGRVLASSFPEENGLQLQTQAPQCAGCHTGSRIRPAAKRLPAAFSGGETIVVSNPLNNEVVCQSCHSGELSTLGVLLVEQSIQPVDRILARFDLYLTGGGSVFLLSVLGMIAVVTHRSVTRPLRTLAATYPGKDVEKDEIQQIAGQIEHLQASMLERESRLIQQRKHFDALVTFSEAIDEFTSLNQVYQHAIKTVQHVTGFPIVVLRLYIANSHCFRMMAQLGLTPQVQNILECIPDDQGFVAVALRTRQPVTSSDVPGDRRKYSDQAVEKDVHSLACIPLLCGDQFIGSMELVTQEVRTWNEDELRWLALVGRSIGLLVNHFQNKERLRELATLEERSRISQEIHDGLAQLLGALRLWAEDAQISLEEKDLVKVQLSVDKIEQTARDAYASVREEMLGLRDTLSPEGGLVPVIKEFLRRYQRQWRITTELQVDGGCYATFHISPAAEIQLLRIIQEGLVNVRRHSRASQVVIKIREACGSLKVEIKDNGAGFNPQQTSSDHLGLRIMRERAASVGGEVKITSNVGTGTLVEITIPFKQSPATIGGVNVEVNS